VETHCKNVNYKNLINNENVDMKIRSLNNATIHVETEDFSLLIDPWLIGDLYKGAWSPYTKTKDLGFLTSINCIFISHIHEDHWDLDTLERVPRSAKIILPNLMINRVIENRIKRLGFEEIVFIDFDKTILLNETLSIKIIPPLNAFAQDFVRYQEGYEYDATNIDTALLLTDKQSQSAHLFLCDNSPYDLQRLKSEIDLKLTTIWYPFNSYAQDYPVCYDSLSMSEKRLIHDEMHKKRVDSTIAAISQLSPKYCLPHSADFVLNGPAAVAFSKYVREDFMDRKKVAQTYGLQLPNINTQSEYLESGDVMLVSNGDISIKRNQSTYIKVQSVPWLPDLTTEIIENIQVALIDSFNKMLQRVVRFDVDIKDAKDWVLVVNTDTLNTKFCFNEKKVHAYGGLDLVNRKVLQINLTDKQLSALLKRELHWNNAMIGCHLKFSRIPNEFCQPVYKALNFLHL
jgi:UDP-MurNAc hydroxylase